MGGSALYIETSAITSSSDDEGKGSGGRLTTTGQMGSVMEESTRIAHTYSRTYLASIDPTNTFFDDNNIHMHVPEGATPKDGPSAGCTMVTALLSLALDKPVRADLAMTGEVSLTGKTIAVGGIKEKTIAARRAGIKQLVFPEGSRRDYEELPDYLQDGLHVDFAKSYHDVYEAAFD